MYSIEYIHRLFLIKTREVGVPNPYFFLEDSGVPLKTAKTWRLGFQERKAPTWRSEDYDFIVKEESILPQNLNKGLRHNCCSSSDFLIPFFSCGRRV